MAKKYISKINKNSQDIHIKDTEAWKTIGIDTEYEYVDLGLPSGTLWAKYNIGAATETGYGNYYMYGKGTTQYNSSDSAYTGTEDPLAASVDTATQVMGTAWHTPTKTQFDELIANTTYSWETDFNGSGIRGGKFTATNGNYVFFPAAGRWNIGTLYGKNAAGYYCSSSPKDGNNTYYLYFGNGTNTVYSDYRICGYSIRGVMDGTIINQLKKKANKSELPTKLSDFTDDLGSNPTHTHSTKADKVSGSGLNNTLAGLNSNGNLKASGIAIDDVATKTYVDQAIEEVRLKVIGDVTALDPTDTYENTSLITSDRGVYVSTAEVNGLPTNVITQDDEVVAQSSRAVTYGSNTNTSWLKIQDEDSE